MNPEDIGTDMTNPEHREIDNDCYVYDDGHVLIREKGSMEAAICSDCVVDFRDAGKTTDRAYDMLIGENE